MANETIYVAIRCTYYFYEVASMDIIGAYLDKEKTIDALRKYWVDRFYSDLGFIPDGGGKYHFMPPSDENHDFICLEEYPVELPNEIEEGE